MYFRFDSSNSIAKGKYSVWRSSPQVSFSAAHLLFEDWHVPVLPSLPDQREKPVIPACRNGIVQQHRRVASSHCPRLLQALRCWKSEPDLSPQQWRRELCPSCTSL